MNKPKLKVFVLIFLCLLFIPSSAAVAGRIILKDGTTEESEHIWQTDKYVHFILKGTKSVEIRFAKEIVARIETDNSTTPVKIAPPIHKADSKKPDNSKASVEPAALPEPANSNPPLAMPLQSIKQMAETDKGISFYDPHRKERYWADRNARFTTLAKALDALASHYGHSSAWVETNMGEENDLGKIHARLYNQLVLEQAEPHQDQRPPSVNEMPHAAVQSASSVQSTSPPLVKKGRPAKDGARTDTPKISTLENMGESVANSGLQSASTGSSSRPMTAERITWLKTLEGIQFYDPRRQEKYWVTADEHYNSFNAALEALATRYHTSAQWVEAHMGDTNLLVNIHNNLENSLIP